MKINLKERGRKILLLIDGKKEGLFPKSLIKDIKESDVDEEEIKSLFENIIIPYAKEIILRNLSVRDRTEKEIKQILLKREFSEETIKRVIEDFKNANLINDMKTGIFIVQNSRGKSKNELRFKLKNIGLKEDEIEEILRDYDEKEELKDLIPRLIKKYKDIDRLKRYLMNKGFEYENIQDLLREYKEEY